MKWKTPDRHLASKIMTWSPNQLIILIWKRKHSPPLPTPRICKVIRVHKNADGNNNAAQLNVGKLNWIKIMTVRLMINKRERSWKHYSTIIIKYKLKEKRKRPKRGRKKAGRRSWLWKEGNLAGKLSSDSAKSNRRWKEARSLVGENQAVKGAISRKCLWIQMKYGLGVSLNIRNRIKKKEN